MGVEWQSGGPIERKYYSQQLQWACLMGLGVCVSVSAAVVFTARCPSHENAVIVIYIIF